MICPNDIYIYLVIYHIPIIVRALLLLLLPSLRTTPPRHPAIRQPTTPPTLTFGLSRRLPAPPSSAPPPHTSRNFRFFFSRKIRAVQIDKY